jgi:hypothetical protein
VKVGSEKNEAWEKNVRSGQPHQLKVPDSH